MTFRGLADPRSDPRRRATRGIVDLGDDVFEDMDAIVARVASDALDPPEDPAEPQE